MNENRINTTNWITRKNITKISLSTMYFSRWKNKVLMFPDRFKKHDMELKESEDFEKFMNFMAQIVQKYGKFGL